jgi:hypothetical protein
MSPRPTPRAIETAVAALPVRIQRSDNGSGLGGRAVAANGRT